MKSIRTTNGALGNLKMRGKKTVGMGCGCCVAVNLKQKSLDREHLKEMRQSAEQVIELANAPGCDR